MHSRSLQSLQAQPQLQSIIPAILTPAQLKGSPAGPDSLLVLVSRTDQAASRLVEDSNFARQVKAACRTALPQPAGKAQPRKASAKPRAAPVPAAQDSEVRQNEQLIWSGRDSNRHCQAMSVSVITQPQPSSRGSTAAESPHCDSFSPRLWSGLLLCRQACQHQPAPLGPYMNLQRSVCIHWSLASWDRVPSHSAGARAPLLSSSRACLAHLSPAAQSKPAVLQVFCGTFRGRGSGAPPTSIAEAATAEAAEACGAASQPAGAAAASADAAGEDAGAKSGCFLVSHHRATFVRMTDNMFSGSVRCAV